MSEKKGNEWEFRKFLYNKDKGEFLGRTRMSWLKIVIFYIIFYVALASFFTLCLYIFYCTLSNDAPKYTKDESLIGSNPGLGFRPQPDQVANADSTLIWYKKSVKKDWEPWTKNLTKFIKEATTGGNTDCDFKNVGSKKSDLSVVCKIDKSQLGGCTTENNFGFDKGQPCILIKLNRIFDWEPQLIGTNKKDKNKFNNDNFMKAVDEQGSMPGELKTLIKKRVNDAPEDEKAGVAKSVWIYCSGENPADRENLGKVTYYPMPGIPSYFFPFVKQPGYVSPFVMVQFTGVTPGVLVNIECKAYAENIKPDRQTRAGSVHFELMVD